jgi:hypothetical protein
METINEILAKFLDPFTEYLKQKPVYSKGKKTGEVDFIPWHYLCEILDDLAPGWEWDLNCDYHGDRTVIVGKLTIHGSDRSISRSATGNEDSNCSDFGDPCSNAEAMALRRACEKFGIGRSTALSLPQVFAKATTGRPVRPPVLATDFTPKGFS